MLEKYKRQPGKKSKRHERVEKEERNEREGREGREEREEREEAFEKLNGELHSLYGFRSIVNKGSNPSIGREKIENFHQQFGKDPRLSSWEEKLKRVRLFH